MCFLLCISKKNRICKEDHPIFSLSLPAKSVEIFFSLPLAQTIIILYNIERTFAPIRTPVGKGFGAFRAFSEDWRINGKYI